MIPPSFFIGCLPPCLFADEMVQPQGNTTRQHLLRQFSDSETASRVSVHGIDVGDAIDCSFARKSMDAYHRPMLWSVFSKKIHSWKCGIRSHLFEIETTVTHKVSGDPRLQQHQHFASCSRLYTDWRQIDVLLPCSRVPH